MALMSAVRPEDEALAQARMAAMQPSQIQHPMHAMVAPIGPPAPEPDPFTGAQMAEMQPDQQPATMAPKQPKVRTMAPMERYEDQLNKRQMADYEKDQNPYGSENNHPGFFGKFLHGLSVATGGPNRRQFEEQERAGEIAGVEKQQGALSHEQAQTDELQSRPDLAAAKNEIAQNKVDESGRQHDMQLRQHGFKLDEQGQVVPLAYDEMSEDQQAVHDLKASQEELADAGAALKRAQADPNSPQAKIAQQRLDGAQQARSIALQRLGLSQQVFNARYHGTDAQGEALPGAMITDDGRPVGSSFSQNVRPTGTQRNKGNMAESADQQISDMKSIVARRPDIFGPVAGRTTDFNVWIGSQDPDAQKFRASRTIAADHLAGTFGGRSEAALNALDNAIGQFKDNPKAVAAGLDQLAEANRLFLNAGKVHSVGAKPAQSSTQSAPIVQHSQSTGQYRYSTDGGKTWQAGQPKQ